MRLTQGAFSFLPDLSDEEIAARTKKEGPSAALLTSELLAAGRALRIELAGHSRLIAVEDAAHYRGSPYLALADGTEPFDTMRDGVLISEHADAAEVIWRDDIGVTCRRWNWRQCKRTALTEQSRDLWFVIDRLEPMPLDALMNAGSELKARLLSASPHAEVSLEVLGG